MSYHTITSLGIIPILLGGSFLTAFGATNPEAQAQYASYQQEATSYCDSNDRSWKGWNTLVPKIDYPELDTSAVNTTISRWRSDPKVIGDEKARLFEDLDPSRIGGLSGFKTLEVARVGYRSRMNSLFACAIIASRIDIITDLQKNIEKKIKSKNSEILQKLKNDAQKMTQTYNTLKCNVPKSGSPNREEMITGLTNTAAHQYCHYRHYLGYLETRINTDQPGVQKIEMGIGIGNTNSISKNISEFATDSRGYRTDLEREILRADSTLPKALASFSEMNKTYGVHLMLTIIYDDYTRLRKALSEYMNLTSQIYQKANNAQNSNKS